MASFHDRLLGAMQLKTAAFEEVEHDTTATAQAAAVVLMASVSSSVAFIRYGGLPAVVADTVWALAAWVLFAGLTWFAGTKLVPGRNTEADLGQLLRTMGFAQAPRVLAFLGVVPILGWPIWLAILGWTIVATVVAVRQALDYEHTSRAMVAVGLAFVLAVVLTSLFVLASGLGGVVVS